MIILLLLVIIIILLIIGNPFLIGIYLYITGAKDPEVHHYIPPINPTSDNSYWDNSFFKELVFIFAIFSICYLIVHIYIKTKEVTARLSQEEQKKLQYQRYQEIDKFLNKLYTVVTSFFILAIFSIPVINLIISYIPLIKELFYFLVFIFTFSIIITLIVIIYIEIKEAYIARLSQEEQKKLQYQIDQEIERILYKLFKVVTGFFILAIPSIIWFNSINNHAPWW